MKQRDRDFLLAAAAAGIASARQVLYDEVQRIAESASASPKQSKRRHAAKPRKRK